MSEKVTKCEFCGKETEELNVIDGHYCCDNCRENKDIFIVCPKYDDYVFKELAIEVIVNERGDIQLWCPEAANDYATQCNHCGKFYSSEHITFRLTGDGDQICPSCVSNYQVCRRCGRLHTELNSDDLCRNCVNEIERQSLEDVIHCYSHKPRLTFYKQDDNNPIFMGFELESGEADDDLTMRRALKSLIQEDKEKHYVFKRDGSIPGYGCELVTHPMTLDYHKQFNWKHVIDVLRDEGTLMDCRGCGLHVHVNRTATNNWNWHKIDAFINNYVNFNEIIAGRSESSYAQFHDVTLNRKKYIDAHEKYVLRQGHGTAVNTENRNTVEIRIFASTFDIEELYARLEYVEALVKYSHHFVAANITNKKKCEIDKFVKYVRDNSERYNNLVEYLSKNYSK